MHVLKEIVERAIEYTELLSLYAPSYRGSAMEALQKLHDFLSQQDSGNPALDTLAAYLKSAAERRDSQVK